MAVAVIAALAAWLATRNDGNESAPSPVAEQPRIVTAQELARAATLAGHSIYWAGAIRGRALEANENADGSIQVRYVGEGVEPGTGTAETGQATIDVLTVTTSVLSNPNHTVDALAEQPAAIVRHLRDGERVVTSQQSPNSVFFAAPDNSVQVQIYDPSPGEAMALVVSGEVRPAGSKRIR